MFEIALPPEGMLIRRFVRELVNLFLSYRPEIDYEILPDKVIIYEDIKNFIAFLKNIFEGYVRDILRKTFQLYDGFQPFRQSIKRILNLTSFTVQDQIAEILNKAISDTLTINNFLKSISNLTIEDKGDKIVVKWGLENLLISCKLVPKIFKTIDLMEAPRIGLRGPLIIQRVREKGKFVEKVCSGTVFEMWIDPYVYTLLTLSMAPFYIGGSGNGHWFIIVEGERSLYRYVINIISDLRDLYNKISEDVPEIVQVYSIILSASKYVSVESSSISIIRIVVSGQRADAQYELSIPIDQYRILIECVQSNKEYLNLLLNMLRTIMQKYGKSVREYSRETTSLLDILTKIDMTIKGVLTPHELKYHILRDYVYSLHELKTLTGELDRELLRRFIIELADRVQHYAIV